MKNLKTLALVGGPLVAVAIGFVLSKFDCPQPIWWTVAITTWVAAWWVFEPIPIPATSLIPFFAFPLGGVVDSTQISTSYGHWLILLLMGGFLLSTAMEKSGAHRRLALMMVRAVGGSDGRRLVLGFMIASAVLSMWISNTATALMLLPIALAVLDQAIEREKLAVPLLLGVAFGANIGGIGTPVGTPPNLLCMEYAAKFSGEWGFMRWMKIGVPVVIILVPLTWLWLTRGLKLREPIVIPDPGKWRTEEMRVLTVFTITALLWITRSEPFGGWNGILESFWDYERVKGKPMVTDSSVALMMVVTMFLVPSGNGSGEKLLDWETAANVPWGLLLLFGGGLAIGKAFDQSGLGQEIGNVLSGVTSMYVIFMIATICLTMTFLTEVTSNTATTALMLPILLGACQGKDGNLVIAPELLMVPAAISASCAFMLPVATAPNAIVFGTDQITTRAMVRNGFVLNLIGAIVITAASYLLLS